MVMCQHAARSIQGYRARPISVPAEVRKKLGVGPGSILEWDERNDEVVVRRAGRHTSAEVHEALFAKGKPRQRAPISVKEGIRRHMRETCAPLIPYLLVRLLARDDAAQVNAAENFVEQSAWVSHLVLAETLWVLDAVYERTPAQLAKAIDLLLNHKNLTLQTRTLLPRRWRASVRVPPWVSRIAWRWKLRAKPAICRSARSTRTS